MLNKKLVLLGLGLTFIAGLCVLQDRAVAEDVGTTPEGNVIAHFRCPGGIPINVTTKLDWPNHISEHPEFDITGSGSAEMPKPAHANKTHDGARRSGQVLTCEYRLEQGYNIGSPLIYRYKVHRDILSCKHFNHETEECILKASGGAGKAPSSIESSSPPSEKCVGLGCETQPNPGGCIGMGCDKKSPDTEPSAGDKESP